MMRKILIRILITLSLLLALLAGWIAYDLNAPLKVNIRDFDADEVARLDTAMWRSYYAKQPLKLYGELTELLQKQYRLPFWRRQLTAFYATKAAFIFKDGHERADYEKALPDVENFYAEIYGLSTEDFDFHKAAKLELEWWIVHRERKKYQPGDLARAIAETAAAIYNQPVEDFVEHGNLRAEAMDIRDTKAEQGGVTEEDWERIDELLHRSWHSLYDAVNKTR